jgi:hypothetical protein
MTLAHSQNTGGLYVLATVKSVLTWAFVLTVCFIVIGFPLFVLVVAVGSLLAFALHAMMPVSAVLLAFIGIHVFGILAASTFLTLKGIHPHEVGWFNWLSGQDEPVNTAVYASCPLTCDVHSEII